jgi:hypothetical protein
VLDFHYTSMTYFPAAAQVAPPPPRSPHTGATAAQVVGTPEIGLDPQPVGWWRRTTTRENPLGGSFPVGR